MNENGNVKPDISRRNAIRKLHGLIKYSKQDDPVHVYIDYLNRIAIESKSARRELAVAKTVERTDGPTECPQPAVQNETTIDQSLFDATVIPDAR